MFWPFWVCISGKAMTNTGLISILLLREEENHTWCSLVVDGWDGPMWSYLFLEPPYICSNHLFPHPHHLETGHHVQSSLTATLHNHLVQSHWTISIWAHMCTLLKIQLPILYCEWVCTVLMWKLLRFELLCWLFDQLGLQSIPGTALVIIRMGIEGNNDYYDSDFRRCLLHQTSQELQMLSSVTTHNWLSGHKDCHEFRFSIVRIVVSVSNVTSL